MRGMRMEGLLCIMRLLWGHKEIAELLIDKGANVNAKEKEGITPLDVAEKVEDYHSPEQITSKKETADLLRKHAARPRRNWKPLATKPTRSTT